MKTETKVLLLTLKKEPFEVMITGEKDYEVREDSDWIKSRLFDKDGNARKYEYIHFINGYGATRPYFICKWTDKGDYDGFGLIDQIKWTFSNGFKLKFHDTRWIIYCGEIVERGNLFPRVYDPVTNTLK